MENKNEFEQKLAERLREESSWVEIPQSVKPDHIKHILPEQTKKKNWFYPIYRTALATCAAVAVMLTVEHLAGDQLKNQEQKAETSKVIMATSYEDVYEKLKSSIEENNFLTNEKDTAFIDDIADGVPEINMTQQKEESIDYGKTNLQVSGVDEADIIKNDGKYLYVLDGSEIIIVETNGEQMERVSTIMAKRTIEFYVDGDRLVVLSREEASSEHKNHKHYYWVDPTDTKVTIYDISDRKTPKKIKDFKQDGDFISSRMTDGILYCFTKKNVEDELDRDTLDSYIPMVDQGYVKATDIILPSTPVTSYVVISSFDVQNKTKVMATKAILSNCYDHYVSASAIYTLEMVKQDEKSTKNQTCIRKYSYDKGKINYVGQAIVDGRIKDSFSIDEYKGNVRVVTTVEEWKKQSYDTKSTNKMQVVSLSEKYNNLYVLDQNLKQTGMISHLAKEEDIYSARFLGDTGYFVTFRQVDPLFSVDLSNPKNPRILGELKVTGFSSYLHFYSEDRLLGIGKEVDPKTNRVIGIKLSMFDVSDPAHVKEVHRKVMEGDWDGECLENHKAILISPEKNLFGFGADLYEEGNDGQNQYYFTFSYEEDTGFEMKMNELLNSDSKFSYRMRATYIDDILYIVPLYLDPEGVEDEKEKRNGILAYQLETGQLLNEMKLTKGE